MNTNYLSAKEAKTKSPNPDQMKPADLNLQGFYIITSILLFFKECITELTRKKFNPLPHIDAFYTFTYSTDPDKAALVRAA